MAQDRLRSAVPAGEALRYTADCRGEGAVGITDERLLLAEDEVTSVELESIDEVTARQVDWFLAVLSVALVGVGVLAGRDNPLLGVGFVAFALLSLVVVYRKRGKVSVSVDGRAKPLVFHLPATEEFLERLGEQLDEVEERLIEEYAEEHPEEFD